MKKFLKVFIIVLLVIASIAGTCYFFFKNMKEKDNTTASIAGVLYSEDKIEFDKDLYRVASYMNSDGTDTRLNLLITTSVNLDKIVEVLSSYHIQNDTKINNEKIADAFNQANGSRSLLNSMIDEYKIKKESPYFDRHTGANDFYQAFCGYLVNYAKFANLMNNNLTVNKRSDFKFSMFDVYTNVVMTTFNETQTLSSRVIIKNDKNINKINSVFVLDNSFVVTSVNRFDVKINNFYDAYYNCNKTEFAINLASNISIVSSANQDTSEKVATYYFKQIFGI